MSSKLYHGNACAAFRAAKRPWQKACEFMAFVFGMIALYGAVIVSHLPGPSDARLNLILFAVFLLAAWFGVGALHWRYIAKEFMAACYKDEDIVALLHSYGGKTPDEKFRPIGLVNLFVLLNILCGGAMIVAALGMWTGMFTTTSTVYLIAAIVMPLLMFGLATFTARARRAEQIYRWVINGVPAKAVKPTPTRSSPPICLV